MTCPPLEWWLLMAAMLWASWIGGAPKCPRCGTRVGVDQAEAFCDGCTVAAGEFDPYESGLAAIETWPTATANLAATDDVD